MKLDKKAKDIIKIVEETQERILKIEEGIKELSEGLNEITIGELINNPAILNEISKLTIRVTDMKEIVKVERDRRNKKEEKKWKSINNLIA